MSSIRLLFEAMPIFAAMFALVLAFRRALLTKNKHSRIASILWCVSAILMIVAQTSWAWSVSVGNSVGTDAANYIWTVFNLTVMVAIIYAATKASA